MPMKPAKALTPASYAGQRYVRVEVVRSGSEQVARCYEHDGGILDAGQQAFVAILADVCNVSREFV